MEQILFRLLATAVGGAFGYGYYKLVGCRSGACPLTSTATGSIFMGAMAAFLATGTMIR